MQVFWRLPIRRKSIVVKKVWRDEIQAIEQQQTSEEKESLEVNPIAEVMIKISGLETAVNNVKETLTVFQNRISSIENMVESFSVKINNNNNNDTVADTCSAPVSLPTTAMPQTCPPPPPPPPPPPVMQSQPVQFKASGRTVANVEKAEAALPQAAEAAEPSMSDVLRELSRVQRKVVNMISSPRSKYLTKNKPNPEGTTALFKDKARDVSTANFQNNGSNVRESSPLAQPSMKAPVPVLQPSVPKGLPQLNKPEKMSSFLPVQLPSHDSLIMEFQTHQLKKTFIPRSPGGTIKPNLARFDNNRLERPQWMGFNDENSA
ncbi:hypothetical protein HDU76_007698 [Blyttiomyces sp. JEL0837]|nr:hypothetical protein HDU76_007698 [Blyttiomyces sp. JEL0837]